MKNQATFVSKLVDTDGKEKSIYAGPDMVYAYDRLKAEAKPNDSKAIVETWEEGCLARISRYSIEHRVELTVCREEA